MLVLVTGGSGFLGSHVIEQLVSEGHSVRCLVRPSSDKAFLETLPVEFALGAVDKSESLPAAVEGVDAVVHCAGIVKAKRPADFHRVNENGAEDLAAAALAHAPGLKRFVLVSSAGVMGPAQPGRPHLLSDPPNPVTHYGRSKLGGERRVLEMKDQLPLTILRPPAIYGPRDNEILAFFKTVRQGRGVAFRLGKSLEQVNMIYGPDCAKACVRAIEADVPSGSTFFVDDGQAYSFGDLASAIADACGVPFRGTPSVPVFVLKAAAAASEMYGKIANKAVMFNRDKLNELLIKHFLCETGDAQVKLSWTPEVMFPEGAQLTADWYRKNGWL